VTVVVGTVGMSVGWLSTLMAAGNNLSVDRLAQTFIENKVFTEKNLFKIFIQIA